MPALSLLNTDQQDKLVHLHSQLTYGQNVQSTCREWAEYYLTEVDIYDVLLIEEKDFCDYKAFLAGTGQFTKKQVFQLTGFLRKLKKDLIQNEYKELLSEIEQCDTAQSQLKGNIRNFLIRQGIHHIREVDYGIRERYENELRKSKSSGKTFEYLKALDRIKQFDIQKEMATLSGRNRGQLKYQGQVIFLPYLPNQELAVEFDYIRDKTELVWDFSLDAPENLKKQVFQILCYALENIKDSKDRRVRYLLPLKWLYEFCIEEGIEDIERLELAQIQKLEAIVAGKVVNVKNSMQIVDNSRKILFMRGKEIHWYANVWYLKRFNFAPERINPSNPVYRLTFYEVTHLKNRELLQEYMRYQVGISGLTIGNIRSQLSYIKKFLIYFDELESICQVTDKQIGEYFRSVQDEGNKAETVNKQIFDIYKFLLYLHVKGHITRQVFDPNYYSQKVYPYHHDRSVQEDEYMEILKKLKFFPEIQRLIFLNLWATGLRISEVCTLKGGAYYWDGEDAWLKVYQIKMKAEKMIPISLVLYEIMKIYIKKYRIKANEFLFKAQDGGAYRVGTFVKGFRANCKKYGIDISGDTFKTHDYRHTLASGFYDDGVSIQTIRDYLGHNHENMTRQYIDYMPKKIEQANIDYFNQADNVLAAEIIPKKRGEKTGK